MPLGKPPPTPDGADGSFADGWTRQAELGVATEPPQIEDRPKAVTGQAWGMPCLGRVEKPAKGRGVRHIFLKKTRGPVAGKLFRRKVRKFRPCFRPLTRMCV